MKQLFAGILVLFLLLYLGAELTRDRPARPGITAIRW